MSKSVNGSFDELVAGISAEERKNLLNKLNQNKDDMLPALHSQAKDDVKPLEIKLRSESLFYRILLWIKSLFQKKRVSELYNDDLISHLAKQINKKHPGTLLHTHKLIQSTFYERLRELKTVQDFFSPYFVYVNENPGSFYIFLSLFIVPTLSERITKQADPYVKSFDCEGTLEIRNSLLKNLSSVLNNLEAEEKSLLYSAVRSVSWLQQFCSMPLIHFIAQFTAIVSDSYTCPYVNARVDFDALARIMGNASPIRNEVLESLFLFPYRNASQGINIDADTERALNEFLNKSVTYFSIINSFIQAVPVNSFGKVVNGDYEWQVQSFGGSEDWLVRFKEEWKKIFNERWSSWLRDKKKEELKALLQAEFSIEKFPELPFRPWQNLWGGVPFHCEMTAGFLGWYVTERFEKSIWPISTLLMEGVFSNSDNRNELSQYLNELQEVAFMMKTLVESLSPSGAIGIVFDKIESEHSRSMKNQSQVNKMIMNAESTVRNSGSRFSIACKNIEKVLHACVDDEKVPGYDPVQNFSQIKGRENHQFKEELSKSRMELKCCSSILTDIEPLDLPVKNYRA